MTPEFKFKTQEKNKLLATLPDGGVPITTLPDPFKESIGEWKSPVTCEATKERAAELIAIFKTHRLATAEEVERMLADRRRSEEQCAALEAQQRRSSSLSVSLAVAEAVRQLGIGTGTNKGK
jgi:hypothetical protein